MNSNPYLAELRAAKIREDAGVRLKTDEARPRFGLTRFAKRAARGKTRVIRPQNWGVQGSF